MKFEQRLVKFSEAKTLIEKQAAQVKAGAKELAEPLKKNLDLVEMYKGVSANGVIDPQSLIPITVEEEIDPARQQSNIMDGIELLKSQVRELLGLAKAAPAPLAKADDETRYMLERVIYKFRDRMAMAQAALDTIEFARVAEAAASQGVQSAAMAKADFAKLLDFDSILEEVGKEVIEKVGDQVVEVVSKMLKADGEAGGEGDAAPASEAGAGGEGDAAPAGDEAGEGETPAEGEDPKPAEGEAAAADAGEQGGTPEESQKGGDTEDEYANRDPSMDLSPPLTRPAEETDGDGVDIEGA